MLGVKRKNDKKEGIIMAAKYEIDMCSAPYGRKILRFSIPLILSGILQLLFTAADLAVVGKFSGDTSLAAVGACSSLTNMFVNLFVGLAVGTNVCISQAIGSNDKKAANDAAHTSILLGIIGGLVLVVLGFICSKPLLILMDCPEDVLPLAVLYMKIIFCGMPAMLVYNYASAILRSTGDTKRPLYILIAAGLINVILNLIFVIVFKMSVDGVALATIISQFVSAVIVLICLRNNDGLIKFNFRKLKIHKQKLINILLIGIPAGVQGVVFSISNVMLQSSINTFGSSVMAGSAAAANIEGFVYTSMNAVSQASTTFTAQNVGAGQYKKIPEIMKKCFLICTLTVAPLIIIILLFSRQLLGIYTSGNVAIETGVERFWYVCAPYLLCGFMEIPLGILRGMGLSIFPTIVSLVGTCGIRIVWIFTVFAYIKTFGSLLLVYPVSWLVIFIAHSITLICYYKKYDKIYQLT